MKDMSLKYIVRECNLSSSEKMFISDFNVINKNKIANQRLEAFAVYTILKMYMGNDKESGFFLKADPKQLKFLASDVLFGIDVKFLNRVISSCFENDLFDKTFYDKFNILTSYDIQDKYFYSENVKRRALKTISDYRDFVYDSIWEDLKLADKNKKDACKNDENACNNKETKQDETETDTQTHTETKTSVLSTSDCFSLSDFASQFPNKKCEDNLTVPENVNLALLSKKVKESEFLQDAANLSIKWLIDHYHDIIKGTYKGTLKKSTPNQNFTGRDYSDRNLNELFDDLEKINLEDNL